MTNSQLDPQSVRDYFARPGTVSQWWKPEEGPLLFHYDAELQVVRERVRIEPDWRVLDVGTGRGRFGAYFATRGCRVIGIDLNVEMLDAARDTARRLRVTDRFDLQQGSAEDLSRFADASFDIALCMELFDHLPDLACVLAEVRRTLKPGGRFLFTYVPSESLYGGIGNLYRRLRGRIRAAQPMISRTYSFAEVNAHLVAHGFHLEHHWGVGLLCISAQTRLFQESILVRILTAIARAEARRWPYYEAPLLARHGAHVVGLARAMAPGVT